MQTRIISKSFIALMLVIPFVAFAQPLRPATISGTEVNVEREIKLEQTSDTEEITLTVEEGVSIFQFAISSAVTAGTLNIEILNPRGESHGVFSVGTQLGEENAERVNGKITRSLKSPQTGDWKVRIVPGKATGKIVIHTSFNY